MNLPIDFNLESYMPIIIGLVILFIILKLTSKFTTKLLGFVVVVGGILGFLYIKSWGPFKKNVASMSVLEEKYCGEDGNQETCDCILSIAKEDMNSRFSEEELLELNSQRAKAAYVLRNSLKATKSKALVCLGEDAEKKYKSFMQDFVPIDNKHLDFLGEKAREASDLLKEKWNDFKDSKDDIDERY